MKFVYFGIYDPEFSRNKIYMRALRVDGHEIIECRDTTAGFKKYFRLARALRALAGTYDAVIVGYPGHVVLPIARLFATAPVVADLLGSISDAAYQSHGAGLFKRLWLSMVDRLAILSAHVVLVESEAQKKYLQTRFGGDKYRVVYTGADESIFAPRENVKKALHEPFVVLFRGRLTPESGIRHVLDAAERLKSENIKFRIVGYGRLQEAVEERVRSLPNVTLISEHLTFEQMREYMLDADVSLGQFEDNERLDRTIPHKAFESMSMGIPYLTGRARGVSELLEDGVSCLMVSVANPDAIKKALERLRADRSLSEKLAKNAHAIYESTAAPRILAQKIISTISPLRRSVASNSGEHGRFSLKELLALCIIIGAFIAIRLPGIDLPYHQDEWKTANIVQTNAIGALSGHPPLTELVYRAGGFLFGVDHLRVVPLLFAVFSAILLYVVVRGRSGQRAALFAIGLYSACMYGVWASLMTDTDGAMLPTLFLVCVYGYDRFRNASFAAAKAVWLSLIGAGLLLGLLTKLSFAIVLGALVLDYFVEMRSNITRALVVRAGIAALVCVFTAGLAIAATRFVIPAFDVRVTIEHVLYYVRFEGRGYMQILIQAMKALFFLSPMLLVPLIFFSKEVFAKSRIFIVYLGLGAFFYFVLFDFSQGALDKYLMYTIVPLCVIVGTILAREMRDVGARAVLIGTVVGIIAAGALLPLSFLSPQVMPLYPKTEWISAVAHGNWNILMPFTGGSGPIGFYVSFLFIGASFAAAGLFMLCALVISKIRAPLIVAGVIVGLACSAVFIEELLWGRINGSVPEVLAESVAYIASSDIKSVITHADTGAYELNNLGKYAGRFYAVPGNEDVHRERFSAHRGHYLVIDFPKLNERGYYSRFFATCESIFETRSGAVEGHVYYCPVSDPYSIPNYASQ